MPDPDAIGVESWLCILQTHHLFN